MGPSHVLADELFGMRQPRYDVALAIGNQFRRCCGRSVFLEMLREPSQVEAGKYDAGEVAVTVVELLPEMNHFLPGSRIDPVASGGKPIVSHRPGEKRLICNRGYRGPACTKDPPICVGCRQLAIIRVVGLQLRKKRATGLWLVEFDGL